MKEQFTKIFGLHDRNNLDEVKNVSVNNIIPSPYQPRSTFDDDRIDELCQSIRTHGVIQPIIVRVKDGQFELIAGERRLRATIKLGLDTIPAIIREWNDSQAASAALIENLQREGLSAVEEAVAYQKLMELHHLTQESLAQRVGKGQSTIANKIRLLQLSEPVKQALIDKKITERHARALLSIQDEDIQSKLLNDIIEKDLNVQQTEARIKFYLESQQVEKKKRRISFTKDVRLAVNTIRQSVDMVKGSGMNIQTDEQDRGDHYEFIIRIPKNSL